MGRKGLKGLSIRRKGLKVLFMGRMEEIVYGKDGRDCLWEGWKVLFMRVDFRILFLWEKK